MLWWWLESWGATRPAGDLAGLALRAALAAAISLLAALLAGSRVIRTLRPFREPIVSDSAQLNHLHRHKQATPTMGGVLILGSLLLALVLVADLSAEYLPPVLLTAVGLGLLGAADDLTKLARRRGLSARAKLTAQTLICAVVAVLAYYVHEPHVEGLNSALPFGNRIELGLWFIPLATLVLVGTSNAVNLTDGLDGLAGSCLVPAVVVLGLLACIASQTEIASAWNIPHLAAAGEMTVVAAALLGSVLGFLWFNRHPARVFMGDTGSLPLGGLLGLLAVAARQEMLLLLIGGVFVVEAGSVVLQVGWFKRTGRRLLRCAPLHHHFQFAGLSEPTIVRRFFLTSTMCGVVALGVACKNLVLAQFDATPTVAVPSLRPPASSLQPPASPSPNVTTLSRVNIVTDFSETIRRLPPSDLQRAAARLLPKTGRPQEGLR